MTSPWTHHGTPGAGPSSVPDHTAYDRRSYAGWPVRGSTDPTQVVRCRHPAHLDAPEADDDRVAGREGDPVLEPAVLRRCDHRALDLGGRRDRTVEVPPVRVQH